MFANSLIIRSFSFSFSLVSQTWIRSHWSSHKNQKRHLHKCSLNHNAISRRSRSNSRFRFTSHWICQQRFSRFYRRKRTNSLLNSSKKFVVSRDKSFFCVTRSSVSWCHWTRLSLNVWCWFERCENASFK